jgi:tRNA threonylcarbamoyl adenosine modification protein (Sua5/YciO/YrdC/YwlC family)
MKKSRIGKKSKRNFIVVCNCVVRTVWVFHRAGYHSVLFAPVSGWPLAGPGLGGAAQDQNTVMSQYFVVHPLNPQKRLITQAAEILRGGGVIVYPTDSCYAFGCALGAAKALERIRAIRRLDERHNFTLACRDLSDIATYARVDNGAFRLLKLATPGPYTFILRATAEVPRRLQHPKRKTIGIRVPANAIALALLAELESPIMTATAILPGDSEPLADPELIRERLERLVDLIIDGGYGDLTATTVIDMAGEEPCVVREGKGELARIGF